MKSGEAQTNQILKLEETMRKITAISVLLLLASALSAKDAPVPEWVTNHRGAYPDADYLAQRGSGKTAETAQTDATSQIARYFQTNVSANLSTTMRSITGAGKVDESTTVVDEVRVSSEVSLFALEHTEPYYYKKEKKWYCVAYIRRDAAWRQYAPVVDGAKAEFYALYDNAGKESEPFIRCGLYKAAWENGKNFLERLEYARILSPAGEAAYSGDRRTVSQIPALIQSEREKCAVHLTVHGDYGNIIETSLTSALTKSGIRTTSSASQAAYTATAVIEPNATGTDPMSINPSVDIRIQGRGGRSVYSLQVRSGERTVAYTLESAQKKAYPALAKKIEDAFSKDLGAALRL